MGAGLDHYFSALDNTARSATGRSLDGGSMIAPVDDRIGSRSATSYPTPLGTIVWCDPALADRLAAVLGERIERAISSDEFVELATGDGAEALGFGRNRVLDGQLRVPTTAAPGAWLSVKRLDRDVAEDVALLAALAAEVSDDDLDEADLELDNLDPFYVGLLDGDRLAAYACGRPSDIDERFDDIGVLVHPEYRRVGLGARAVAEFVRQRQAADPQRLMLYRCTTENAGSNRIAESLGFSLAHTIGAVRFPE